MDAKLLESFTYLFRVVQRATTIKDDAELQIHRLKDLLASESSARLPARIYAAHWQLYSAVKISDAQRACQIINNLDEFLPTSEFVIARYPSEHDTSRSDDYIHSTLDSEHREYHGENYSPMLAPSSERFRESSDALQRTIEKIRIVEETSIEELQSYVTEISLMKSEYVNAGSSFTAFGFMYFHTLEKSHDWTTYLEHLIHETAHHHLYAVISSNPIFLPNSETFHSSPLRPEPRPMSAIFHQMFVLARVIRIVSLFQDHYPDEKSLRNIRTTYKSNAAGLSFESKFHHAATTLLENAKLTDLGIELLERSVEMVNSSQIRY